MATKAEAMRTRHAEELALAEREDAIQAVIPPGGRLHMYSLYGTVGGVSYESAAWADAKALVRALPPVPLMLCKNGCTSFKSRAYVEALPEDHKDRGCNEEQEVSPVLVQIEGLHGPKLELEWTTRLPSGDLLRVRCKLGYIPQGIGRYEAKRVDFRGGHRYEAARFFPADELHTVHGNLAFGRNAPADHATEPVAQLEAPIRWHSGGPEYPGNMTLYFCDLGADMDPAMVGVAIVDHLAKLATEKK
jgi:hypothetical protein